MNRRAKQRRQRSAVGLVTLALALAPAAPAGAHEEPGAGQSALPPADSHEHDGGTSPFAVGGVAVGLLGLAGGLIYVREKQRGPGRGEAPSQAQAASAPLPAATDAEPAPRA